MLVEEGCKESICYRIPEGGIKEKSHFHCGPIPVEHSTTGSDNVPYILAFWKGIKT